MYMMNRIFDSKEIKELRKRIEAGVKAGDIYSQFQLCKLKEKESFESDRAWKENEAWYKKTYNQYIKLSSEDDVNVNYALGKLI